MDEAEGFLGTPDAEDREELADVEETAAGQASLRSSPHRVSWAFRDGEELSGHLAAG
ncbi:MAG TPA: hypothetical protein VFH80_20915 [Solirubrobacteraceae bacterium]|nr:hypothetical protein [Solirubrobacteraceae bacterium]